MKRNMGSADRIIRFFIAITIAAFYLLNVISGTVAYILLVIAGIFLITSLFGTCPLYSAFGLSTRKKERQVKSMQR